MPTYGQTGYSGSTTTGTISSFGGSDTYTANTTLTPKYGITGYVPKMETTTLYGTWIVLSAYDLKVYFQTNKFEQVWKTSIATSGKISDSRRIFPLSVVSTFPKWATNTEQTVTDRYDLEGEALKKFKIDNIKPNEILTRNALSTGEQCSKVPLNRIPASSGQSLSTDNQISYKEFYKDGDTEISSTDKVAGIITMAGTPIERINETFDPNEVRKILRDYVPQFNCCYQNELNSNKNFPRDAMKTNFKFSIESNGKVTQTDITMERSSSETLTECLKYVLSEVQFPKNTDGRRIEINQPINFKPKSN